MTMEENAAEESRQVQRARAKLAKIMDEEQEHYNKQELAKARKMIQAWIDRHSDDRVDLKEKSFQLFDQNKHPAKTTSRFVLALRSQLTQEVSEEEPASLKGRIVLRGSSEVKTDLEDRESGDSVETSEPGAPQES